jgi:hypothetical protein
LSYSVLEIIQVKCPGLYSDAGRGIYIELAGDRISSCYFGRNKNLAIALQACHDYTMDQRGGDAGTVSAKREGDLSVSYSVSGSAGGDDLSQTSYGMALKRLIKQSNGGAISVTGALDKSCLNPGIIPCEE